MARRYLGYGITNSQGVAKLEYLYDSETQTTSQTAQSHSYTGVGAGKVDIVAESGSLQSETYEIMDYINFDNALSTDYSDMWNGNTTDLTREADGSLFSSTSARKLISKALISGDFEATFEAYGTNSPLFGVEDGSSNRTRFYIRNDEDYTMYKLTRIGNTITAKYSTNEGSTWTNLSAQSSDVTTADCYFLLQNHNGTKSIKFKNVKIYPI